MNEIAVENTSDLYAVRVQKLEEMRSSGFDPFRANWDQKHTSAEAIGLYKRDEDQTEVSVAGRIVIFRDMGKACFLKLLDRDGLIQLYVKKDEVGESAYLDFKKWDIGDIMGASGPLFKTKTGEVTVRTQKIGLLSKSLRSLPEKWHGLVDEEQRLRQRYLDLITNQESRNRMIMRTKILQEIRQFLWSRDFREVETPMLQNVAGGAAARPFVTHMNALDCDFVMRISLELYLKRMLVGGFDRVFELGRVFRNEGLSRRHNPEFTMLEVYQAYSDFRGMMDLMRDMVHHICEKVIGSYQVTRPDGVVIDLSGNWREATYKDLIIEATKDPQWFSRSKEEKLKRCSELGIQVDPNLEDFAVTNDVFEKCIEPTLIQPTFVTHIPKELCPLAKLNQTDSSVLDVFELCINGQEIAPAYSEQNDPFIQREMFEKQVGDEKQEMDTDFLHALEYGMPPAGGMGVGIDRLTILLTGASNIRDTILFPTLKAN
ncbi:MAG: lysine--tRNA ligase [Verrucomicrobia bacterium GWC2_42_7]|nr:MAG: lysine--tRNA ligase [Verrucomicrobia bacterium GWC2_42_7]